MTVAETSWAAAAWGRFWTPSRQRVYPRLLLGLLVIWGAVLLFVFWGTLASRNEQYGADFVVYYSAGQLAGEGRAPEAYDARTLHRVEQQTVGDVGPYPYYYPPHYLLLLAPFSLVPYSAALVAWIVLTAGALATVLRSVVRSWSTSVGLSWFVPAYIGIIFGQNGLLTAALLGGAIGLVDRRPILAGLFVAGLAYKPQFLPVVLVGFLVGRRWLGLASAAITCALLLALSFALFGPASFEGFFDSLDSASDSTYLRDGTEKMVTPLATAVEIGLPRLGAQLVHTAVALPCLTAVALMWLGGASVPRRNAATALATILVSPYAYIYDLPVLLLVSAWLTVEPLATGSLDAKGKTLLAATMLAPLWTWIVADLFSIQLASVTFVALLTWICGPDLRRFWRSGRGRKMLQMYKTSQIGEIPSG